MKSDVPAWNYTPCKVCGKIKPMVWKDIDVCCMDCYRTYIKRLQEVGFKVKLKSEVIL